MHFFSSAASFAVIITVAVLIGNSVCQAAAIDDNNIVAEPRIRSSENLISTILDNCFHINGMFCIKEKLLNYLDTMAGVEEDISGRAIDDNVIDKVILDRVSRILHTNEFRLQLPNTIFANSIVSYRSDRGFDLELPQNEGKAKARRDKKKDSNKLFLPLLLLMKLKLKVIMPILMSLIGLKAFKALILSKIAIKLVLGFLIYNLIQKLGGMKMTMMPMPPQHLPAIEYGVPNSTPSSYEPNSWEPANSGPYARSDAHYLSYSSYQPSSAYASASSSSPNSYSSNSS